MFSLVMFISRSLVSHSEYPEQSCCLLALHVGNYFPGSYRAACLATALTSVIMALNCFVKPLLWDTAECLLIAPLAPPARTEPTFVSALSGEALTRQGRAGSSLLGGELLWDYTAITWGLVFYDEHECQKGLALTRVTEFSGRLSRQRWGRRKQALCVSQLPTDAKCRLLSANSCSSPKALSDSANPLPLPLGILFSD